MEKIAILKKIIILLEEQSHSASLSDAEAAVRVYRKYGFEAELLTARAQGEAAGAQGEAAGVQGRTTGAQEKLTFITDTKPATTIADKASAFDTLCIADSSRLLKRLADCGAAFCAYAHSGNTGEDLSAAEYVLMEPQWVDRDSLVKIWQRQRDIPWTILETERCLVREFVCEDLDAIYELYDEEAKRFLEPPSRNRSLEREILKSYIRRVYRLGGYGDWAVIEKESGRLIGRMGFSFPSADTPEPVPDVTFGYLVHAGWRGRGITKEVGQAILAYGFTQLGFTSIGADAAVSNIVSDRLLRSFGFVPIVSETKKRRRRTAGCLPLAEESAAGKEQRNYYILHSERFKNGNEM